MRFPRQEWVAISSSRGSSWPRDQTRVSCYAGDFFTTEPPGKPIFREVDLIKYTYILNFLMFGLFLLLYIFSLAFFFYFKHTLTFVSSFISTDWIVFLKESPWFVWASDMTKSWSVNLRLCLVMLKFNHINAFF